MQLYTHMEPLMQFTGNCARSRPKRNGVHQRDQLQEIQASSHKRALVVASASGTCADQKEDGGQY